MRRTVCLVALAFAAGCSSKPAQSLGTGVPAAAARRGALWRDLDFAWL